MNAINPHSSLSNSFAEHDGKVLIQFRLQPDFEDLACIRRLPDEDLAARGAREARHDDLLERKLERTGVSLEKVPELLLAAGFVLADCYVQRRSKGGGEYRDYRTISYDLVTFVFKREPIALQDRGVFSRLCAVRRENVKVARIEDSKIGSVLIVFARGVAASANELKQLPDLEAEALGLAVTRAVKRKKEEKEARPPVIVPLQVTLMALGTVLPRQPPKPPAPAPKVLNAVGDPQLVRMLAKDGWELAPGADITAARVRLQRRDSKTGEMKYIYHLRKRT